MESADKRLDGVITPEEEAQAMAEITGTATPISEEEVRTQAEQEKRGPCPMNEMFRRMAKRDAEEEEKEKQARALSEALCGKIGMKPAAPAESADPAKDAFYTRLLAEPPAKQGPASLSEAMHEKMGNKQPTKKETPLTLSEAMKHKGGAADFENYRPHVKRRPVG